MKTYTAIQALSLAVAIIAALLRDKDKKIFAWIVAYILLNLAILIGNH